ncbi:MAG TPA: SIMPL domain-containing protein [Chloroflexota bacterium]|nr:SIMPL domain-containing protein [Chloroflexota bacterium]
MRFGRYLIILVLVITALLAATAVQIRGATALAPVAAAQGATATVAPTPFAGITVSGEGTATATPDVAYISAGVTTQAATAKQASDANSTTMTAVIAAIKAAGVADQDLQTGNFSINPVYSQSRDASSASTITGYRVDNSVNVTVNIIANAAKVLDAAVTAGANSNVSIRFGIKDTTALQDQALKAAVQQAAGKAGAIAQAAGLKLAGAYSVEEQSASRPVPVSDLPMAAAASAAVPVQQGQLVVSETVQVTYAYSR